MILFVFNFYINTVFIIEEPFYTTKKFIAELQNCINISYK